MTASHPSRNKTQALDPPREAEMADQERIEMELRLSQKLEAVGQLAAGIAHEINTPMQFIGDNVHFLKSSFEDYLSLIQTYQKARDLLTRMPEHDSLVNEIKKEEEFADLDFLQTHVPRAFERTFEGMERVRTIVQAMREFSHPDQREKIPTDLNQGLMNTLTVATNEYKYVADVITDFGHLPPVICLGGDINQVFLNLIINATHAISDVVQNTGAKGKIWIKTEMEDGNTVLITIRDSGSGIPEEIRGRVFDPFFTTKDIGKGTGQGLAIARSVIVDKHGGDMSLESEVGTGSTFFIRLPINGNANES
ncbi:MAG: sensor histidine kinase [Nitrospiria bacterium]